MIKMYFISVDKEELRMDRAVKVSRKELNELMAELFDFTENVMHHASDDEDSKSDRPEVCFLLISMFVC